MVKYLCTLRPVRKNLKNEVKLMAADPNGRKHNKISAEAVICRLNS